MCLHGTGETVRSRTEGATTGPTSTRPPGARSWPGGFGRVVDLSHTISPDMPSWDEVKPTRETLSPPAPDGEFGIYLQRWSLTEHTGTHLDAPGHVIGGGRLVPDIAPEELVVPAVVLDIRERAAQDPDTTVEVGDVLAVETANRPLPAGPAGGWGWGGGPPWGAGDAGGGGRSNANTDRSPRARRC